MPCRWSLGSRCHMCSQLQLEPRYQQHCCSFRERREGRRKEPLHGRLEASIPFPQNPRHGRPARPHRERAPAGRAVGHPGFALFIGVTVAACAICAAPRCLCRQRSSGSRLLLLFAAAFAWRGRAPALKLPQRACGGAPGRARGARARNGRLAGLSVLALPFSKRWACSCSGRRHPADSGRAVEGGRERTRCHQAARRDARPAHRDAPAARLRRPLRPSRRGVRRPWRASSPRLRRPEPLVNSVRLQSFAPGSRAGFCTGCSSRSSRLPARRRDPGGRGVGVTEVATVLGLLDLLFFAFVLTQLRLLLWRRGRAPAR